MRARGAIRATTKWAATISSALILLWWVPSGWCAVEIRCPLAWIGIGGGTIAVDDQGYPEFISIEIDPISAEFRPPLWLWLPSFSGSFQTQWWLQLPLWMPLAPTALTAALMWRTDIRRARNKRGCCSKCGYDRRGLAPRMRLGC
jgi:hypothetical protein